MKLKQIVMACLALATGSAQAVGLDQVIAGATGYLSGFSNLTLGFYGHAGSEVVFAAFPTQNQAILGFCGVAGSQSPEEPLATAYSNEQLSFTLPADDLYIYLCIRAAGSDGEIVFYAAANDGGAQAQVQAERDEFASTITLPELPMPTGRGDQLQDQLRQLQDNVRSQDEGELLEALRNAIEAQFSLIR